MKASIHHSIWTNLYHATLLGGEFDNCHGQGESPEGALMSLKLTINVRRKAMPNLTNIEKIKELDAIIKRLVELGCKEAAYSVRVESDKFRDSWK